MLQFLCYLFWACSPFTIKTYFLDLPRIITCPKTIPKWGGHLSEQFLIYTNKRSRWFSELTKLIKLDMSRDKQTL